MSQEQATEANAPQQQTVQIRYDDSNVVASYANVCRVTGTPEELIIDFGINPQPIGSQISINVSNRIVTNFYTAKRMRDAIHAAIVRYEQAFGVLETEVQKRIKYPEGQKGE